MSVLAKLNVEIGARIDNLSKGLRKAEFQLKRAGRNFQRVGDSINRSFTLPFAAAGAAGVKLATDLDTNFRKIENLVGRPADEVARFKKEIADLSTEVGRSQNELSQALFVVTSAGAEGAEAMNILESAAKASASGLGNTTEIARAVTSAITAYGKENLTAARATEVLFNTVREGNLDAESLAPVLGRLLGIASDLGVGFDELGANIAAFTRLGVNAEEAATGLRSVMNTLMNPTDQTRAAFEKFGLSADDVRKMVGEKGLAQTLIFLRDQVGGNTDALGELFPNIRALANFLGVAGNQADSYLEITESLTSETDNLGAAFENVTEGPGHKFNVALVQLQNSAIELGNILIPIVTKIIDKVTAVSERFSKLDEGTKSLIVQVGLLVSGFGIFAKVGGMVISGIGGMLGSIRGLITALKGLRVATLAAWGAMTLGASVVITGIVASFQAAQSEAKKTAGAFQPLVRASNQARAVFDHLMDSVKRLVVSITGGLKPGANIGETAANRFKSALAEVVEVTNGLVAITSTVIRGIAKLVDWLRTAGKRSDALSVTMHGLGGIIKGLIFPIKVVIKLLGGLIKAAGKGIAMAQFFGAISSRADSARKSVRRLKDELSSVQKVIGTGFAGRGGATSSTEDETTTTVIPDLNLPASDADLGKVESAPSIMDKLNDAILRANVSADVLGDEFDSIGTKIGALQDAAIDFGIDGQIDKVGQLKSAIEGLKISEALDAAPTLEKNRESTGLLSLSMDGLQERLDGVIIKTDKLRDSTDNSTEGLRLMGESFGETAERIVESGIESAVIGIASAIGEGSNIAMAALGAIAGMLDQLGKLAIATGIAISGIKKALSTLNPFVAIAAGAALVALAGLVRSKIQNLSGAPKLAKGGLAFGETTAIVGDNPNARVDPEVISPLSKLKDMIGDIGGRQKVDVSGTFRVRGTDLQLVLERSQDVQNRTRGF